MPRDPERSQRTQDAIHKARWDALICALPKNVLMFTGYWPVIGSAIAIVRSDGLCALIAPKDESEYFEDCGADEIVLFNSGELERPTTALDDVRASLTKVTKGLEHARIGIEQGPVSEEMSYVAMTLYQCELQELLHGLLPRATFESADDLLMHERAVLTIIEQERLRIAAGVARNAFETGVKHLREGLPEATAAQQFQVPLWTAKNVRRADGRVSMMSGKRSGVAYGSFAMSSNKELQQNELILVHCNSHADGYWTDITRTYFIGKPNERRQKMYEAMLAASSAGIDAVKLGVRASEIDRIVREGVSERGFAEQFKHGTGHGVGFSAIDHRAIPRLRPNSPDVLETGMVMNIEPGIYFENFGGMRHCDMVLVTEFGCEVLTPFHNRVDELVL